MSTAGPTLEDLNEAFRMARAEIKAGRRCGHSPNHNSVACGKEPAYAIVVRIPNGLMTGMGGICADCFRCDNPYEREILVGVEPL